MKKRREENMEWIKREGREEQINKLEIRGLLLTVSPELRKTDAAGETD